MKFIPLLAALSLGLGACSAVPNHKINYVPPSTTPIRQSVDTARGHADKTSAALVAAAAKAKTATERIQVLEKAVEATPPILTLAQQVHSDIDDLTKLLLTATTENTAIKKVLDGAATQIITLQDKVNEQTTLLNTSNDNLNKAITQGALDKKHAHEYKWALIGLAAVATGFLVFAIFGAASIAPPLLYVLLGAPAAVSTFLFFWLGSG
jgi:hypothetical protein